MNDRLSAKLRMYKRLLATIKRFTSWQAVPAFVVAVQVLETEISAINALNPSLQGDNSGVALDKNESRLVMIEHALAISGALQAHAHDISSHELEHNATVTPSDFRNAREMDVDDLAMHIYELGKTYFAHLGNYGVTQIELDELAQSIETFSEKIGQPREILTSSKETRQTQQAHFDNADLVIQKKLDNMIGMLKRKDPLFFDAYQSARDVIRTGGKSTVKEPAEAQTA